MANRPFRALRACRVAAVIAVALTGLTCRDRTLNGPGLPLRGQLSIVPHFLTGWEPDVDLIGARAVVYRSNGGDLVGEV